MYDSRISISIDVSQSNSPVRVMCKQGDTGRVLLISLTDSGYPYVISKDCYAVFTAVKPDGKIICNPCQILNGVIIYTFTAQTCACPGRMTAEIRLYGDGDKLLTSASFLMCVDNTVYRDGDPVVSDSEITLLTRLISETNALNQEIRDGLDSGAFIGPQGPAGPQGIPGEMTFGDLSEEEKESLRGAQGPQGETGNSGVYIGKEPPVDPNVNVWIDPDGDGEVVSDVVSEAVNILRPEMEDKLAEMKASGVFDGDPGPQGPQGEPGQDGANGMDGRDGADGAPGMDGVDGKSAYELAVANGFSGSETQWLESLRGSDGRDGADGKDGVPGADGAPGADGHTPEYGVDYGTPEQIAGIAQQAAELLELDVNQLKDDIANIQNDAKTVSAGKVWTSTADGAEWKDITVGDAPVPTPPTPGLEYVETVNYLWQSSGVKYTKNAMGRKYKVLDNGTAYIVSFPTNNPWWTPEFEDENGYFVQKANCIVSNFYTDGENQSIIFAPTNAHYVLLPVKNPALTSMPEITFPDVIYPIDYTTRNVAPQLGVVNQNLTLEKVNAGDKYFVTGRVRFIDRLFNDISGGDLSHSSNRKGDSQHIVPENAAYVRYENTNSFIRKLNGNAVLMIMDSFGYQTSIPAFMSNLTGLPYYLISINGGNASNLAYALTGYGTYIGNTIGEHDTNWESWMDNFDGDSVIIAMGMNYLTGDENPTLESIPASSDWSDMSAYHSQFQKTTLGQVGWMIEYIQHFHPDWNIYVMNYVHNSDTSSSGRSPYSFGLNADKIDSMLSEYYGIPKIDVMRRSKINLKNYQLYMKDDGIHPNDDGAMRTAEAFAHEWNLLN